MREHTAGLWNHIAHHPVWSGALVALFIAGGGAIGRYVAVGKAHRLEPPAASFGPERPVYWCRQPRSCDGANHVVFNSYANAPNYGDERAFVDAKPAQIKTTGMWSNILSVKAGEEVVVRLYVNNAAWAAKVPGPKGIAVGTVARVSIPLTSSQYHEIYGFVSARNAEPRFVWDGVTLLSHTPTEVRYVFSSAQWYTKLIGHGIPVPDALMEEGTPIGSSSLDGLFGDNFGDSGLLTFRLLVKRA
jgi:hypothetical protein